MKAPLILFACLSAALNAFGQAQVQFQNTAPTRFSTNGTAVGQGTGLISGVLQWRIGLYVAPDGQTNESQFTLLAVATNQTGLNAGRFIYGNDGVLTIDGNNGTPIMIQVRAWRLSSGSSYEEALLHSNGYLGKSSIGRITPAGGPFPQPTSMFGNGAYPGQLTNGVVLLPHNFGPSVGVVRPDGSEILKPGSVFRIVWAGVAIPTPDWSLSLRTNSSGLRPLSIIPVNDGGGNWHADFTVPTDLPSGCDYEIILEEHSLNLTDTSQAFCIGPPVLRIRYSQVELCWNTRSDRTYQAQYRSSATTNLWTNLGSPVPGNGLTNCIADSILLTEPQRQYRIEELP